MNRIPFATTFGTGWVLYDDTAEVTGLRLPGGDAPEGEDADRVPAAIRRLASDLERYFAGTGPLPEANALLARAGSTALQQAIYRIVAAIPAGATMSYGAVAAAAGRPGAARAVGTAMARNPFAPVIPCHRVVAADGGLGGYGGGLVMKEALLRMEHHRDA